MATPPIPPAATPPLPPHAYVLGHGIDLVSITRIREMITKHPKRAQTRIFTVGEWAYAHKQRDPARALAKRWAAKEAVAKALGTGIRGAITLRSIEVVQGPLGQPRVELHEGAAEHLHSLLPPGTMPFIHLSLSDEGDLAMGSVVVSAAPSQTLSLKG